MKSSAFLIPKPDLPLIPADTIFWDAYLKAYWARKHAYHVSQAWDHVVKEHFIAALRTDKTVPYEINDNLFFPLLPIDIPLSIGDCIRNLRTSLDYLVSALARQAKLSDRQTLFPFAESKSQLEANFQKPTPGDKHRKGRKAGALYDLSIKYPNLKDIVINHVCPCRSVEQPRSKGHVIWSIITSDYIEKHRLMLPVSQRTSGGKIVTSTHLVFSGIEFQGPPFKFPVGTRLMPDSDYEVDLFFKEPARLDGLPVTSTLFDACNAVDQVIAVFEEKFPLLRGD